MLKIFCLFLAIPSFALAHNPRGCDSQASKRPSLDSIINKYKVIGASTADSIVRSEVEVKRFWKDGWPELKRMAQESGTSISDIFNGYYENMIFIQSNMAEFDSKNQKTVEHVTIHRELVNQAIAQLEKVGPKDTMKRRHWESLTVVYSAIFKLMGLVTNFMAEYGDIRRESPVDPFAPYTADQIHSLFESLEILTLDRVLEYTLLLTRSLEREQKEKLSSTNPSPSEIELEAPAVEEALADVAVDLPTAMPPTELNVDASDLATVLKMNLPLKSSIGYRAATARGEELKVHLSPNVMREDEGVDGPVVRRLLRSLITASHSSGIVRLPEVGPKIVEVRAIMRGAHKRLIGCLEGRELNLKFLIDIRNSGGTYSRRIDTHLCE